MHIIFSTRLSNPLNRRCQTTALGLLQSPFLPPNKTTALPPSPPPVFVTNSAFCMSTHNVSIVLQSCCTKSRYGFLSPNQTQNCGQETHTKCVKTQTTGDACLGRFLCFPFHHRRLHYNAFWLVASWICYYSFRIAENTTGAGGLHGGWTGDEFVWEQVSASGNV